MKLEENLLEELEGNEEIKTNKITKVIEYIKNNLKEILDTTPKWGYPVIFVGGLVGLFLGSTILIYIPGVTIFFIIGSSKIVKGIDRRLR